VEEFEVAIRVRQLSKEDLNNFSGAANIFESRPDEIKRRVQPSQVRIILKSFADGSMSIS
jgi:hypothetical protein